MRPFSRRTPTPTPTLPNRLSHRGVIQAQIGISERVERFSLRIALAPDFSLGTRNYSAVSWTSNKVDGHRLLDSRELDTCVWRREGWRRLRIMGRTRTWAGRRRGRHPQLRRRLRLPRHSSTMATRQIDLKSVSLSLSSLTASSHDQLWSLQTILIFVFAIAALLLIIGALVWRCVLAPDSLFGICFDPC